MNNQPGKYLTIILLSLAFLIQPISAGVPPDIVGESAILIERTTGAILHQKNANTQRYPASTTKILTSIISIENLDTSTYMTKTEDAMKNVPADSSHIGLRTGDIFSIIDALYAVMLGSDNYASHDLAILLDGSIEEFSSRMNTKAIQIGAYNSHFVNPHGYHDPNHYTTAYDMALIMDYAVNNPTFYHMIQLPQYILSRSNDPEHPIEFKNTVKLVDPESPYYYPDALGGKTGFTTPAGRNLVALARQGDMELIGVVLKSTASDFFSDTAALFDYGFENFTLISDENGIYLDNHTYSPWASKEVSFSLDNQLIDLSTRNYQTSISKKEFLELLMRTIYVAQNETSDNFSNDLAINQALAWNLIENTSLLSGFNDSLSRKEAALLTTELLAYLHYDGPKVYPVKQYSDHNEISMDYNSPIYTLQQRGIMGSSIGGDFRPNEDLSFQEALALVNQIYKLYSNSFSVFWGRLTS